MRYFTSTLGIALLLSLALSATAPKARAQEQSDSLLLVFNDGHQETLPMAGSRVEFKGASVIITRDGHPQSFPIGDIARIEFNTNSAASFGRGRFVGRWRVGVGDGMGQHFYITLSRDGEAYKSRGRVHGTWRVFDGEARITWDDGWRDEIRKVDSKYEKVAFGPGSTFSDDPTNIADAESTDPGPL